MTPLVKHPPHSFERQMSRSVCVCVCVCMGVCDEVRAGMLVCPCWSERVCVHEFLCEALQ